MIIDSWEINSELKLCHIDKFDDSFNDLVRKHFDDNYPILRWREHLNPDIQQSVKDLNKKLNSRIHIDLAIFKGDQIVAWSYGWQGGLESATFYMANSCVIPEYRRQGLYTILLNKMIELCKKVGFHTLTSRHVASNNNVIIAKLKASFKISGIELSEIHGNLIHLTYFNNELREESFAVRSGFKKPVSEPIKNLFS
ncbi:MAG: GNAT family N-acetyltransferase [Bacteriovoracaceae bacterium]|nr:GNAT family N-acetyltransferase [Bacteriovoracaceae bacterium]